MDSPNQPLTDYEIVIAVVIAVIIAVAIFL
jgi:hypothetical protein